MEENTVSVNDPERARFERMALRVANAEILTSPADTYEAMPERVRQYLDTMTYCELIRPLVFYDRFTKQWSVKRIAKAYTVTRHQVYTILSKHKTAKT